MTAAQNRTIAALGVRSFTLDQVSEATQTTPRAAQRTLDALYRRSLVTITPQGRWCATETRPEEAAAMNAGCAAGAVTTARTSVLRTIREVRIDRGLTLADLAAATGINKGTLSQVERGRIVANQAELTLIGAVLGVRLENRTVPCVEVPA